MHLVTRWRALASAALVYLLGAAAAIAATAGITRVGLPANGTYSAKYSFTLGVYFNDNVTVTGTPTLGIRIGSVDRQATFSGASNGLVAFTYQPVAGDNGSLSIPGPISLNGGSIKGSDGTDASLSFTPVDDPNFIIDSTPPAAPVISAVTPASPIAGQTFRVTGSTEPYTAVMEDGLISNSADSGGSWYIDLYRQTAGTHTYQFVAVDKAGNASDPTTVTVTVQTDPSTPRPVVSNTAVSGYVGTWINSVKVPATNSPFTFTAGGLKAYGLSIDIYGNIQGKPTQPANGEQVAVTADNAGGTSDAAYITLNIAPASTPKVVSVTGPADGLYGGYYGTNHPSFFVTAHFDQTVVVTGHPSITVQVGSRTIAFTDGTASGASINFALMPQAGSGLDGSLKITGPINLNGGTIKGTDGSDASLAFTPVDLPGVYFDTTEPPIPVVTAVTPASPTADQTFTLSGTAEPNDTMQFYLEGHYTSGKVDATGNWTQTFGPLPVGDHTIYINAQDAAHNWAMWPGAALGATAKVVTVQAASSTPTPPPPPSDTPPPPSQQTQTIAFVSPVSAVMVGQPVTLGATSSAGLPITYSIVSGDATISGNTLTPTSTATLVVRAASAGNDQYAAASTDVNFGNPQKAAQTISTGTAPTTVKAGASVTLDATSSAGLPVTYTLVSGPATFSGNTLTVTGTTGTVVVRASQAGTGTVAPAADVTLSFDIVPVPISRLVNISSRVHVSADDASGASIAGFVVSGTSPKQFLIRAVGPTLSTYGISNLLAAPQLRLFNSSSQQIASNSGWADDAQIAAAATAVNAFPLQPGSKDAALLATLAPGTYTAQVASSGSGTALVEVYDVTAAAATTKQLINISTRGSVGTGDNVLIGGFVIAGDQAKKVLIRAVGPTIGNLVPNVLRDPILTLYDAHQAVLAVNDNWGTSQPAPSGATLGSSADIAAAETATGAFPLETGSADAALLLTLPPGSCTAIVTGANGSSGNALVEVYEVP